ncbi:MAG: LysE family translocator [Cyclobacteriaceae bacterium]
MFGIVNFWTFIFAGVLLNLTPGTDTFYILGKSISSGKKEGIFAALGIGAGSLVHTTFAALGLSAILSESALAFDLVKYLGAGYLMFLGIKAIFNGKPGNVVASNQKGRTFLSAVLTNVLNPKVALFYLAFLPQFIDPNYQNHMVSFLILGVTFTFSGTLWGLLLANYASRLSTLVRSGGRVGRIFNKVTGLVFISLGLRLAMSRE